MSEPTLRDVLKRFVDERDWAQFHSPANLAKSIVIEAAERQPSRMNAPGSERFRPVYMTTAPQQAADGRL